MNVASRHNTMQYVRYATMDVTELWMRPYSMTRCKAGQASYALIGRRCGVLKQTHGDAADSAQSARPVIHES